MMNDLRFALRMIASHRWYAAAIVVTLALGIGINTTVFTLVNAVLFKSVPVPGGSQLVSVSGQNLTQANSRFGLSHPDFLEVRAQQQSFTAIEGLATDGATLSENGNPPEQYRMARVTAGLFQMIQTQPVLGRGFSVDDAKPGAERTVLLGDGVWRNRYGATRDIVGRPVRVNGVAATIIGVMPPGFKFPNNEDLWMTFIPGAENENRTNRPLQVFALLKPGVSIERARVDIATIAQRLAASFPEANKDIGALVQTFHERFNGGQIRSLFLTMFGAVGLVLVIACANVAVLMLGRSIDRRREIALRAALGASRGQIIRQLLIESVLLSVLGGVLGLGLAAAGVRAFDLATSNVGKPYWIEFSLDWVVVGYFAAISIASGLLFGLAPALRASRVDLNVTLKEGSVAAGGRSGSKLVAGLVVAQFAFTVILLIGAGLMVRSFFSVQTLNEFVPVERIFTARLNLPGGKDQRYSERTERLRFYEELQTRLAALPGVTHASFTSNLPAMGGGRRDFEIEGQPLADPKTGLKASSGVHTPGYFATINLPVLAGREFNTTDGDPGKEAVIVTREFAARFLPNREAIGARLRFLEGRDKKPGPWLQVVGVSGDMVQVIDEEAIPPLLFTPLRQDPNAGMGLVIRTTGDPAALAPTVRALVQALDQDMPLFDIRTMQGAIDRSFWYLRVFGSLFFTFALVALLMASVGLYAVVARATSRRTREIGIRMALGATSSGILRLVLSSGLTQLGIGLLLGLGGAFAAAQLLTRMLVRVSPYDPGVFVGVTVLLTTIGILACSIPARRAAALQPVQALREE